MDVLRMFDADSVADADDWPPAAEVVSIDDGDSEDDDADRGMWWWRWWC